MTSNAPEALRIVAQLRARFLREYSASLPRTPLIVSAQKFDGPQPRDPDYDTTSTALYVALRGAPAAEIAGIKTNNDTDVTRLFHRALQVYAKAASQRLYFACQRWRATLQRALFDHPTGVRELIGHLQNDHSLVITTTRDGELSIDMRAATQTPLGNPGIIYARPLAEHAAFKTSSGECAEVLSTKLDQAIRAAEHARESQASRSRSTPREVGETRILSQLYSALTPEVTQACYQNLLALAATKLGAPEELGRMRVLVRSNQPIRGDELFDTTRVETHPLGPVAAQMMTQPAAKEWVIYAGHNPVAVESCYFWHAARTRTSAPAQLLIDSNQPLRIADAALDLAAGPLCENDPARQAQLWAPNRADQAPVTPAQFHAALQLAYPALADNERYHAYTMTYPGKPDAVRRWATRDGRAHVPRDSLYLLLIRAGYHREYQQIHHEDMAQTR